LKIFNPFSDTLGDRMLANGDGGGYTFSFPSVPLSF